MTRDFKAIPIIDLDGFQDRPAVARAIADAARNVGFFYIRGHGVPPEALHRLRAAAEQFFSRPLVEKLQSYIGLSVNHSGYVPEGEEVFASGKIDKKEAYDVGYDATGEEPIESMLGPNLWPDLPGFKADVADYYARIESLARDLFGVFALAMDLSEDFFADKLTAPPSQLRLIHYPHDPDAVDAEGIGAHTDYECFTILFSTAPGLEVMNGKGEWIDAPPIEGCFIINISDMIEAWTNGAFVATSHRVRKVSEERYSFPFFATCDFHTVVEPLPHFVSAENPPRYPRIVSGHHLYAQTAQTFAYLKARIAAGKAALPTDARALSSFGQHARAAERAGV